MKAFKELIETANQLQFRPHRIEHLLDEKGRHHEELPAAFPFLISLFQFKHGKVTRQVTWHDRLEILVPLDGPTRERMGDEVVDVEPGGLLIVDNLKPHQVEDFPGLNTRVVVITFLPEFVYSLGSPSCDYAFLLPFYKKVEGRPHVMPRDSERAPEVWLALNRILRSYFTEGASARLTGCKAWFLVLLESLVREFQKSALLRSELLRQQERAGRLKRLFDHIRDHYAERISLGEAARMSGMSEAQFGRVFKQVSGMTFSSYLNHVRLSHAVILLEETTISIAEIAMRLGFSDQSHFDKRFRQAFGRTPSQHRHSA